MPAESDNLKDLTKALGYAHTFRTTNHKKGAVYVLELKKESIPKLYNDIKKLQEKHPTVSLGFKQKFLEDIIRRLTFRIDAPKGNRNTPKRILDLIKSKPYTAYEISKMFLICRSGAHNRQTAFSESAFFHSRRI